MVDHGLCDIVRVNDSPKRETSEMFRNSGKLPFRARRFNPVHKIADEIFPAIPDIEPVGRN